MNIQHTADLPHMRQRLPRTTELAEFVPDPAAVRDNQLVGFNPRNAVARPFNLLRTQVVKRCAQQGWKTIGVTSAEPGAGKSFVSLNLAAALSRVENQFVYLFDFDLSRASVAKNLNLEVKYGLADYLSGEVDDLASIGRRVADHNLAVFPTGSWSGSNASLLASTRFAELAAMMRNVPDGTIVICDLPPVFANDDAMIIAQSLDAYLAVANSGGTNEKQLAETFAMLEPTPRLGTILNRYKGGFTDPYGYGAYTKNYHSYN
jgi:protein-tyrosine kinase